MTSLLVYCASCNLSVADFYFLPVNVWCSSETSTCNHVMLYILTIHKFNFINSVVYNLLIIFNSASRLSKAPVRSTA